MFRGTRIDWSTVTSATERTIAAFSSTGGDHAGWVVPQPERVWLPMIVALSCHLAPHYRFFLLRLCPPDNLHCRISLRIMGV